MVRGATMLSLALLFALLGGAIFRSGGVVVQAGRALQDATDYPGIDETPLDFPTDESYPGVTDYPDDFPTDEIPTEEFPTAEFFTPQPPQSTATVDATQPPNTFLTENAEMGDGQASPPPSETPGPTITPYGSPTAVTGTPEPTTVSAQEKNAGQRIDWGLFWMGFSVPIIAACGLVLYLLDKRPDLLRLKK